MSGYSPTAPLATLHLRADDYPRLLVMTTSIGGVTSQREPFELASPETMVGIRKQLRTGLEQFKDQLPPAVDPSDPGRQADWARLANAFGILRDLGKNLLHDLFRGGSEGARFARELAGIVSLTTPGGAGLPTIEVVTEAETVLPLEFLPVLDLGHPPPAIVDDLTLQENASRFLGFSCFVRRVLRSQQDPTSQLARQDEHGVRLLLDVADRFVVCLFRHVDLPAAGDEAAALAGHRRFDVVGPYPEDGRTDVTGGDLVHRILGCDLDVPVHVLHFACHCRTDTEESFNFAIGLRGRDGPPVKIDLQTLKAEVVDVEAALLERDGARRPHRPIVFMNACASGLPDPYTAVSLPAFFLMNRYLGFVGTEARVPDRFAAWFSRSFYARLAREVPFGRCVQDSKWHMLREHKSPLGILYTSYLHPHLEVRLKEDSHAG